MQLIINKKTNDSKTVARLKKLCLTLPDYRTFIDDYLKIVEFIEWLKDFYPEKAMFPTEKT